MKLTIRDLIQHAIREDLPQGDLTTDLVCDKNLKGKAKLVAKEDLVLSGAEVFEAVFKELEPNTQVKWMFNDGDLVLKKQTIAVVSGNFASILKAERTALNFLGHLCGIATLTRCYVEKLKGTSAKLLDTRKTTPLLRSLQKEAVRHGGGENHRMNLSEAILIKENHIAAAGSIKAAVQRVREESHLPIEVEVTNLQQVQEAIECKVERMMFDNMSNDDVRKAVDLLPADVETEASGNMSLDRIEEVAATGVKYISVGALTHSAPNADLSLLVEKLQ